MGNLWSSQTVEDDDWKSDAQYAMESGTYCVICSNPFDIEGDVYNLDPKEPRYQWLFDFRLLGQVDDLNNHRLTSGRSEPVNTSSIREIFLSEKAEFQSTGFGAFRVYDESRTEDIWFNPLWYSRNSSGTLFPLHEACIEISCRAIDHLCSQQQDMKSESALVTLYHFLNDRFLDHHANIGPYYDRTNDIFGSCHRSEVYGPRSVLSMTRLEWWGGQYDRFYANPIDVPGLEGFVFNVLLASSQDKTTNIRLLETTREPYGIERLPVELLDVIRSHLPTQAAIKLHRTSKIMAMKLQLDNAFWRDSLRAGGLHPHIWSLDIKAIETLRQQSSINFSVADWDWRSVAKLLATKQFPIPGADPVLEDMPLGLWNRCRIWSMVERTLRLNYLDRSVRNRSDSGVDIHGKSKVLIAPEGVTSAPETSAYSGTFLAPTASIGFGFPLQ